MSLSTLANRYAITLMQVAKSKNIIDSIYDESIVIRKLILTDSTITSFFENPVIATDAKILILNNSFDSCNELLKDFITLLCKKKRIALLAIILEQFEKIVEKAKNVLCATVSSSVELSEKQILTIKKQLEKHFNSNIVISTEIKSDIIGGYTVRVGDTIIDNSISYKLNLIEKALLSVG